MSEKAAGELADELESRIKAYGDSAMIPVPNETMHHIIAALRTPSGARDGVEAWAIFDPDGAPHSVTPEDSEPLAWQEFTEQTNWRTRNRTPEEWKAQGCRAARATITAREEG